MNTDQIVSDETATISTTVNNNLNAGFFKPTVVDNGDGTTTIELLHRWTGEVLFSHTSENNSLTETILEAVSDDVDMDLYLERPDFSDVILSGVNFSGSLFIAPNFSGSDLEGVIFDNTLMPYSNFNNTLLQNSSFTNASLEWSEFNQTNLNGSDFTNAILKNAQFNDCSTILTSFTNAYMIGAEFNDCGNMTF